MKTSSAKMNFLITWIAFLVIHGAAYASEDTSISTLYALYSNCQTDGFMACNDDCTGLRYCIVPNEIVVNCQTQFGKPFCNNSTKACEATVGICPSEEPEVKYNCPGVGSFPYASDCKKYWSCPSTPPATLSYCLGNNIFDTVTKKCAPVSFSNQCVKFSDLCKGKEQSFVVHTYNKASYAYCNGEFPIVRECSPNHVFNLKTLKCEIDCKVPGYFEDPEDEECYYLCTNYYPNYKVEHDCCPDGTIFNSTQVACVIKPKPTTTPRSLI